MKRSALFNTCSIADYLHKFLSIAWHAMRRFGNEMCAIAHKLKRMMSIDCLAFSIYLSEYMISWCGRIPFPLLLFTNYSNKFQEQRKHWTPNNDRHNGVIKCCSTHTHRFIQSGIVPVSFTNFSFENVKVWGRDRTQSSGGESEHSACCLKSKLYCCAIKSQPVSQHSTQCY